MNAFQMQQDLRSNPDKLINAILHNNPDAVAQNAINNGILPYKADKEELLQIINNLLALGKFELVVKLLKVPFNPFSGNGTSEEYAPMFNMIASSHKSSEGSDTTDWMSIGSAAVIAALTTFMSQTDNTNSPVVTTPPPGPAAPDNTLKYVLVTVFSLITLGVVIYLVRKFW